MRDLSILHLILASGLVALLAGLHWRSAPRLAQGLGVGLVRCAIQLSLVGLLLEALFSHVHLAWVAAMALVMALTAGREMSARQTRRFRARASFWIGASSIMVSSYLLVLLALLVAVRPEPWYHPQYAIPLLGMLLGNTMNGIALAMDRLTDGAITERRQIEAQLLCGRSATAAIATLRSKAVSSALTPAINGMAAAGLVSLPGMMTGQILAGSAPMPAVRYQIFILMLITAGTGFGTYLAVQMAARRLFDGRMRLRVDRLAALE